MFLSPTIVNSYKFVLATPTSADPPAGADVIWTRDNVGIVPNSDANIDILGIASGDLVAGNVVAFNGVGSWYLSDPSSAIKSIDAPRGANGRSYAAIFSGISSV